MALQQRDRRVEVPHEAGLASGAGGRGAGVIQQGYSEDALIEQPAIALFAELGWETVNGLHAPYGAGGTPRREPPAEIVLVQRLRPALERLNPDLPGEALTLAIQELARDRSAMSAAAAN